MPVERRAAIDPAIARRAGPPQGDSVTLALALAGQAFAIRNVPESWVEQLHPRLLACRSNAAGTFDRAIDLQISSDSRLRAPAPCHDLNATSKMTFRSREILFEADWCRGCIPRNSLRTVDMAVYADAAPWFGGILENLLRMLVAYAVHERGGVMLHSAAIVRGNRAAVLFGHSGAGKSTCSALALEAGCGIVSDDINIIEPSRTEWTVSPVPFSGTLTAQHEFQQPIALAGLYHLNQSGHDALAACSRAQAVSLLAGNAPILNQDPFQTDRLIDILTAVTARVPVEALYFTRSSRFLDSVLGPES